MKKYFMVTTIMSGAELSVITPWSKVLFKKLIEPRLIKKVTTFYGLQKLIIAHRQNCIHHTLPIDLPAHLYCLPQCNMYYADKQKCKSLAFF
jgi:hypothetical protein